MKSELRNIVTRDDPQFAGHEKSQNSRLKFQLELRDTLLKCALGFGRTSKHKTGSEKFILSENPLRLE